MHKTAVHYYKVKIFSVSLDLLMRRVNLFLKRSLIYKNYNQMSRKHNLNCKKLSVYVCILTDRRKWREKSISIEHYAPAIRYDENCSCKDDTTGNQGLLRLLSIGYQVPIPKPSTMDKVIFIGASTSIWEWVICQEICKGISKTYRFNSFQMP